MRASEVWVAGDVKGLEIAEREDGANKRKGDLSQVIEACIKYFESTHPSKERSEKIKGRSGVF